MSKLVVKVTQNGSSREYLFSRPGPIIIGSDERCDLRLEDSHISPKLLEIKLSGGKFFLKEVGMRSEIYLNSVILPFREEVPYKEGDLLTLPNSNYQIQVHHVEEDEVPPPFHVPNFKARLEFTEKELKDKEEDLRRLNLQQEKKVLALQELEGQCHSTFNERARLEGLLESLRSQKEGLLEDIQRGLKNQAQQEEKDIHLKSQIERLELEDRALRESIMATNQSLLRLKDEREIKNKEMDNQRILLANLNNEVSQKETKLAGLHREHCEKEHEIQREDQKIQLMLKESEEALLEKTMIEQSLAKLLHEKSNLNHDVRKIEDHKLRLEISQKEAETRLHELKSKVLQEQAQYSELQGKIERHSIEEGQLRILNTDLQAELDKIQDKIKFKKDQLNQYDFQAQETLRKLTTANFELERLGHHLKELSGEEEAQQIKITALREELRGLMKKGLEDKKERERLFIEDRRKYAQELKLIQNDIVLKRKDLLGLESEHKDLVLQHEKLKYTQNALQSEVTSLEAQVKDIESHKILGAEEVQLMRNETLRLQGEKGRIEKDLSVLRQKLADGENLIKERLEEAHLEMENFKREERSKMLVEKEVLLSEVEVQKQKTLIDIDMNFRKQQEDLNGLAHAARHEADDILREARSTEETLTKEAQARLKTATIEAQERELHSHERIKAAHAYFKEKESEALAILQKSKLDSRELVKQSELELIEDLKHRKQKIKQFLTKKQERTLVSVKNFEAEQLLRLKNNEHKANERLEHIKRKELKKIARLREGEITRQHEQRTEVLKEVHAEKDRVKKQILAMRSQQESELAETKKTVLEHINQTKFRSQSSIEEEIKAQREAFEQSKDQRIKNASQAMINVMIGDLGIQLEDQERARERIQSTLKMAIDGQRAESIQHVGQVLDINPELRKKIFPVITKFTLSVGLPAALAIVLFSDAWSLRTSAVDFSKALLKQHRSASDIFVANQKEEWKEKYTYTPETTEGYKDTFTNNVLFTTDFVAIMDNEQFQNDWILKIHEFMVKELELSEDIAISYISSEGTLVKELDAMRKDINPQFKDLGMAKLMAAEETHLGWLKEKIPDPLKAQKFINFRKEVFDNFYKGRERTDRDIATEEKTITEP